MAKPKPTVVLFEDDRSDLLDPLHYLHASWDILAGTGTVADLVPFVFPGAPVLFSCREEVAPVYETTPMAVTTEFPPGEYIFVNGRILDPWALKGVVKLQGDPEAFVNEDGELVAMQVAFDNELTGDVSTQLASFRQQVPATKVQIGLGSTLWEYMLANGERISADSAHADLGARVGSVSPAAVLENKKAIFVGDGSCIEAGVVLDATNGPIIIGENVRIGANSVIRGPVFLDDNVLVQPLSLIKDGTSIGHTCKVGGEIGETIMLPYSNKQHYGGLVHAVVGSWVNLGGGTTNSDLKNTYGTVKLTLSGEIHDTGHQFIGCFLGDFVRTGVNTILNTGTVMGPVANLFHGAPFPTTLPPFTWYDAAKGKREVYDLEKSFETIERAMDRRDQKLTAGTREVLRAIADVPTRRRKSP